MALSSTPEKIYGSKIRIEKGYRQHANSWTYVPIAIIGAGESGIAMGCRLKEALGFDQFRMFEKQSGVGGTWWINRYPGVACDVPAVFYSFSFCPKNNWTSFFPSGPEILEYLQGVCEKYELVDKIQLDSAVKDCTWNDQEKVWELTIQHLTIGAGDMSEEQRKQKVLDEGPNSVYLSEEKVRAKIVISGVGGLTNPNPFPSIPGKEVFKGDIFHSARWRYDVDLKNKNVVVIGTGCSAAQFVPRLTKEYGVKSVTQLMRSPPWVQPRAKPPFGDESWERYSPWLLSHIPPLGKLLRTMIFWGTEQDWPLFGNDVKNEKHRNKLEQELLRFMKRNVPEKYHEILTPDYGVGCKRRIFDATWFPALNDPKIELTTRPLTSIQENSVTLGPGRNYPDAKDASKVAPMDETILPADVLILANGFETTQWLHPLEIVGKEGRKLHDVFKERGGAQMYQGTAMDGFPNLFVLFGPNTATGHSSVILASENMVEFTLKFVKPILKGDVETFEVKKTAEIAYTTDLQRALKNTVWQAGGCNSWYKGADGWNSTVYPYRQAWFMFLCKFPKWNDWNIEYTSTGLFNRRKNTVLKFFLCTALLTSAISARRAGVTLRDVPGLARAYSRAALATAARFLQSHSTKI